MSGSDPAEALPVEPTIPCTRDTIADNVQPGASRMRAQVLNNLGFFACQAGEQQRGTEALTEAAGIYDGDANPIPMERGMTSFRRSDAVNAPDPESRSV